MTVEQIRAILLAVADQQAKLTAVEVVTTEAGVQYLRVTFALGAVDYFDSAGKPVFPT